MNKQFESLKATRMFLLNSVEGLTIEQLNSKPVGFNNNIIWNLAHIISAQQGVCYKRAGLQTVVSEEFFQEFKPDTKPERIIGSDEISKIKNMLIESVEQFRKDYAANLFSNYPAWTTRYGVELGSIDDALTFLLYHEGLHCGYILALKRVVVR